MLGSPRVEGLGEALDALRSWQHEGAPMQLHPGDVGWLWRFGAPAVADAVRTWRRGDQILAVGMLDGPDLLRMTVAPEAFRDEELARTIAADIIGGVLPAGEAAVEAPPGALVDEVLGEHGWSTGEPWTPLRRDLTEPVPEPGLRIEGVGPDLVSDRTAVQRAAFEQSIFTDERWHAMAAGPAYADARCLVAYDATDAAVAAVTVWSAGPGRPGLIEPMGVHRDHRGRGHGTAITVAAAAALRAMGASSALVCTPSSNTGGVATYRAAGFEPRPQVRDRVRGA